MHNRSKQHTRGYDPSKYENASWAYDVASHARAKEMLNKTNHPRMIKYCNDNIREIEGRWPGKFKH